MTLREKIRTAFAECCGRQPSEEEVDDAVQGYLDQRKRLKALDDAGLSDEELDAAVTAEIERLSKPKSES